MSKRFIGARQTTIAREARVEGAGVHSGAAASITLHPAPADAGLKFLVTKKGRVVAEIAATYKVTVSTVEHLLSALRGLSVDNCYIEIDSREVPIMDGSAAPFVAAIDEVGLRELSAPRKFIKVLKSVTVAEGDAFGEIAPHSSFHLDVEIDFPSAVIGRQRMSLDLNPGTYRNEVARARTFGFMHDVEKLWKSGLALGASLENTVAIGEDRVINPEGLRFPQEFVRHKLLDAVGDLTLAGLPLLGAFRSVRGGHRLNSMVLQALFADPEAWSLVEAPRVRDVAALDRPFAHSSIGFAAERT